MDYQAFLAKLRETPRDWYLTPNGHIRRGPTCSEQCPISALTGGEDVDAPQIADDIGLDLGVTSDVISAADILPFCQSTVRADLLSACGLTEREKGGE